jgi:hypothetical protein
MRCTCANSVGAYRDCQATHSDAWMQNRQWEETAVSAMDRIDKMGLDFDASMVPGVPDIILNAIYLRRFYDRNIREGRLLHVGAEPTPT